MHSLQYACNLLYASSEGKAGDLDLRFLEDSGKLHLGFCPIVKDPDDRSNSVIFKLKDLPLRLNELCPNCVAPRREWRFSLVLLDLDSDIAAEANIVERAALLEESFAAKPPGLLDFSNSENSQSRGSALLEIIFDISSILEDSELSEVFGSALSAAKDRLSAILVQLQSMAKDSEPDLLNTLAWDLATFHESKIVDILNQTLAEKGLGVRVPSEDYRLQDSIVDAVISSRQEEVPLSSLNDVLAEMLFGMSIDGLVESYFAKIGKVFEKRLLDQDPGHRILVTTPAELVGSHWDRLARLTTRYGTYSNKTSFSMVVPGFCLRWLKEFGGTGFKFAVLDQGDSESVIDTTVRLHEEDLSGIYTSLNTAYQAAVNLV